MAFTWSEKTINWYAAAVAFTGFGQKLADVLTNFLPKNETVCDMGCGIGYLALELASRGYRVTAIDKDTRAIGWLRNELQRRGISLLEVVERDWLSLRDRPLWDNIVMVSAGRRSDKDLFFRSLCRKRLIIIDRTNLDSHVRSDGGTSVWCLNLPTERGEHLTLTFSLEFGQPLKSVEDARDYISTFGGAETLEDTLSTLINTGNADYPFYLPYRKNLELIIKPSVWHVTTDC
ncbi:MAG TPA: methyltransferase [Clostridiales bacterium]|nr:methyltransferase [Clostridiales bacterium]